MLIPPAVLARAEPMLRVARRGLRVAVVECDVDPLDLVRAGGAAWDPVVFYSSPSGARVGGLGVGWRVAASGAGRFPRLDRAICAAVPEGTRALLGFSFAPAGPRSAEWRGFPAATALVPEVAVWGRRGRSRLCLAVPGDRDPQAVLAAAAGLSRPRPPGAPGPSGPPEPVPPVADWTGQVAGALAAIRAGRLGKVVLARACRVTLAEPAAPFDLVARLARRFARGHVFGWKAGPAALVGASPELLVRRQGERFVTRPLAGSIGRGADPEEDRRLGTQLLGDAKERAEHAFVVDEMVARLIPLAASLRRPAGPRLERLGGVQHLATRLAGSTRSRLLALVEALHPTAAVGGVPRPEALAYIDRAEALDRGWYAGGVGWADPNGDGEVAVALRCALLRGTEALVYAGAGIVAGSDPQAEVAETDLKMNAVLGLFAG